MSITCVVPGNTPTWVDSGVLITSPFQALTVVCQGLLQYAGGIPCNGGGTLGPANLAVAANAPVLPINNGGPVPWYGLAILLLPDGQVPNAAVQVTTAAYRLPYTPVGDTAQDTLYAPVLDAGGRDPDALAWRIWLICNDDNRGNNLVDPYTVTLTVFLPDPPATPSITAQADENAPTIHLTVS